MKTSFLKRFLLLVLLIAAAFSAHARSEPQLIDVLQSSAGVVEKCEACKELRLVGSAKAVPALAALLTEERVSQAARYALEGIPFPEADTALHEALNRTSGLLKAGVADSLGWRHDAEAVPLLLPLLSNGDTAIARAAVLALGRIGGQEAIAALEAAKDKAAPAVREGVVESLLRCAERVLAEGNPSEATRLYQPLTASTEAEQVRVAAHAGLIRAAGNNALSRVSSALEGNDPAAQVAALQLAGDLNDPNTTQVFAELLPKSPPAMQKALLTLLQRRRDPMAQSAVLACARATDSTVRVAAFAALGELGDAGTVELLAEAATSSELAEQNAARNALATLHRGDIAGALVAQLGSASPTVQVELARALTTRAEQSAIPQLLQMARSDRNATRKAALQALGRLADGRHLAALVQLLADPRDEAAREDVRGVFELLVERSGELGALDVTPIVTALNNGDLEMCKALFPVSALFADARLRAVFRSALKDSVATVRSAAARALCDTRDAELLPDLLELARHTPDATLRSLALEGIVRLATDESAGLPMARRTEALAQATDLAVRVEDKRMVLSGLARVPHPATLKLVEQAGDDAAVKAEAELANFQIAQKLGSAEFEAVEAALSRLAVGAGNPTVKANARALLKKLDSGWLYAGPYRQEGKEAQALFEIPFAPEQADAAQVSWRRAPGTTDLSRPGEVDLAGVVGGNHCVVYLKTRVFAPAAQPVLFSIGTDDGIKLWVNGELVHANNAVRGLTPDQDKAQGRLRSGWNDLLAKITQHTAGCGMILRITHENGAALPGLRLNPQGDGP